MLGNHYLLASSPTPAVYFLFYKLREIQKEEEEEEVDLREASMGPLPFLCVCSHSQGDSSLCGLMSVLTSTPSSLLLSLAGLYQQLLHWILFQAPLFLLTPKEVRQACCTRDPIMYRLGLLVVSCNMNFNCS